MMSDALRLVQSVKPAGAAYFIYGDEIQLMEEARAHLRKISRATTREQVRLEDLPDSPVLKKRGDSLFGGARWVEVIARGSPMRGKKNDDSSQSPRLLEAILKLVQQTRLPDVSLFVCYGLEFKHSKAKWHAQLRDKTVAVHCKTLKAAGALPWANYWLAENKLQLNDGAKRLLVAQSEGNLTACKQAILRAALVAEKNDDGHKTVDEKLMAAVLSHGARHTVFELAETAVGGDGTKALAILNRLREMQVADILILWSLSDAVDKILAIKKGRAVNAWGDNLRIMKSIAADCDEKKLAAILRRAVYADKINKGLRVDNIAVLLARLVIDLAVLRRGAIITVPGFY